MGYTPIKIDAINNVLDTFDANPLPFDVGLPLPGYTLEGRIGGFILPFDIGFKIGALPETIPLLEALTGIKLNYLLVGGDIRYSLLPSKIPLLKVSAGLGFNHLNGGISIPVGAGFGPLTVPGGYTMEMSRPELGLLWNTNCLELKVQASVSALIFTPYIGLGMNYSWSQAGYQINSRLLMKDSDGKEVDSKEFIDELKKQNIGGIKLTDNSIESILKNQAFNMRVYGGFSINMAVIRLDLTGMYDLFNENFGMTFGIRFQTKSIIN
jgi:hypothetical protein